MATNGTTDNNLSTATMIGKLCEMITTMQKNHEEQMSAMQKTLETQQKTQEILDTRLKDLQYSNRYLMELNKIKYMYACNRDGHNEVEKTLKNISDAAEMIDQTTICRLKSNLGLRSNISNKFSLKESIAVSRVHY